MPNIEQPTRSGHVVAQHQEHDACASRKNSDFSASGFTEIVPLRRSQWAKRAPNPRFGCQFLDDFIRCDTYAAGRVSCTEFIDKFNRGFIAKMNDYPKQLEIETCISALFESFGVLKNVGSFSQESAPYLKGLYPQMNKLVTPFTQQLIEQVPARASIGVFSPIIEEFMTAFSIVSAASLKGLSVGEMSRKNPEELRLAIASAVITFAASHARNPHRGAYIQAAAILIEQASLPSSYSRQYLSHGIVAAIGSHTAYFLIMV